jgi:hypothetical protein
MWGVRGDVFQRAHKIQLKTAAVYCGFIAAPVAALTPQHFSDFQYL